MSVSYIHCQSNTFAGIARSYKSTVHEGFLEEWSIPAKVLDWHRTYDMDI